MPRVRITGESGPYAAYWPTEDELKSCTRGWGDEVIEVPTDLWERYEQAQCDLGQCEREMNEIAEAQRDRIAAEAARAHAHRYDGVNERLAALRR